MFKKEIQPFNNKKSKSKELSKTALFQEETGSDSPAKTSFKQKFIHWLKQLPLQERYLAAIVKAPGLAKKIMEVLAEVKSNQIDPIRKDTNINKKLTTKQIRQIIEAIVLITDGEEFFSNLGFQFSYIEFPQRLYQLLTVSLTQAQKQMFLGEKYNFEPIGLEDVIVRIQKAQSREELAFFVISFLRGQIFKNFQQKKFINIDQQKSRKKQFSVFWRNLPQQPKKRILLLNKQDIKSLATHLAQKGIQIDLQTLIKEFDQMMGMKQNDFCNKIFKCKLKKSLSPFIQYYELIYKTWKYQLFKRKQRRMKSKNLNNSEKPNSTTIIHFSKEQSQEKVHKSFSLLKEEKKNETVSQSKQLKRRRNKNRRKKSVSAESKETKATSYQFMDQGQKERNQQVESKSDTAEENTNPEERGKSLEHLPAIDYHHEVIQKLEKDIEEYTQLVNSEANEFYDRRLIAYERIQFLLSIWQIPINLFGSCASGIAVKDSDIDIAVNNSILDFFTNVPQSQKLLAALDQLQHLLKCQPWVSYLKVIKTASVPLIKMKINTSVKFTQIPGYQIYPCYFDHVNREHSSSGEVQIDLSIETMNKNRQCNHLGIISTKKINEWLLQIKCLQKIVIMFKNYLTLKNLNVKYQGGLNTYSMICMIVAFIKDQKLEEETNTALVLEKLCRFYGYEFDEKLTGIDLLNPREIFYQKIDLSLNKTYTTTNQKEVIRLSPTKSTMYTQADFQMKDPLNNGRVITRNCYSFPKIKEIFKTVYEECFIEPIKNLQQLVNKECSKEETSSKTFTQGQFSRGREDVSNLVRRKLQQCKVKLPNRFLTLFE